MEISALRKLAGKEEIDYSFIISALKEYAHPREKISSWLKSGKLIRVKKGLYVFGDAVAHHLYSKEVLANLIYGPSAISLIYALYYYGLVPEKVEVITSITNKRIKSFATGVGNFQYYYLHPKKYAVGIELNSQISHQSFLIASPEKSLCDQIHIIDSDYSLRCLQHVEQYLFHFLRIDETLLLKFRLIRLKEICDIYRDGRLFLLYDYIKNRK